MNLKKIVFISFCLGLVSFGLAVVFAIGAGFNSPDAFMKVFSDRYTVDNDSVVDILEQTSFPLENITTLQFDMAAGDLKIINSPDQGIHVTVNGRVAKNDTKKVLNVLKSQVSADRLILSIDQEALKEHYQGTSKWGTTWNIEFKSDLKVDLALPPSLRSSFVNLATGDIDVKNATLESLTVNAAAGDLELENTSLKELNLVLAAGDLEGNLKIDRLKAELLAGDIELQIDNASPQMDLNAAAGDVKLKFREPPNVKLKFDIMAGDVAVKGFTKNQFDKELSLGEGAGQIQIESLAGDVHITY